MRKFAQFAEPILSILSPRRRTSLVVISLLTVCMGLVEMGVAGSVSLLGIAMSSPESFANFPGYDLILALKEHMPGEFSAVLCTVMLVLGLVCGCIIFKNMFLSYLTWRQNRIANDIAWDCMCALFSAYLHAPYVWHTRQNSADLQLYLTWKYYVSIYVLNAIQTLANSIVIIILLSSTCIIVGFPALMTFVVMGLVGFLIYRIFRMYALSLGRSALSIEEQLFRSTAGCLHGIREVQLYGTGREFLSTMQSLQAPYVRVASVRDLMGSVPQWLLESMGTLILLGVFIGMVVGGSSEAKAIGALTLLAAVCWRLLPAVNKLLGSMLALRSYLSNFLTIVLKIKEIPQKNNSRDSKAIPFRDSIVLENITFSYPDALEPALSNVSLAIHKGSMVGFIGMSGSGKSTLVSIISGLLAPESGNFIVDGNRLSVDKKLNVGYVPQNLYLLDATLAENIAFSAWGKSIDAERVRECCRLASLDFVDDLPAGIASPIGERGARLSGGQVQRVGIARALYGQPDVLIFDEATSALDGATEAAIQQTVESLQSNMTILIVAHRLSTVENCDYVYWLENGKIRMHGAASDVLPRYKDYLQDEADQLNQYI